MPRNITFRHPGSFVTNTRHCRISTPSNENADEIDREFGTIVLLHPLWADGFFFYPQMEDPVLVRNSNLVAIDSRAHGSTTSAGCEPGYDHWMAADDIQVVLNALGIDSAHIVGCSTGALTAVRFASRYECASLTCVGLPSPTESDENAESFRSARKIMAETTEANPSWAGTGDIMETLLSFAIDRRNVEPIRELMEDYGAMHRKRSAVDVEYVDHYVYDPLLGRNALSDEEVDNIRCPVLLLHGEQDNTYSPMESTRFQKRLLAARSPRDPLEVQVDIIPNSPHWSSLYCPSIVNNALAEFLDRIGKGTLLSTPSLSLSSLSPPPSPFSAKRSVTPRDNSSFRIPPLSTIAEPGQVTLGDVERMYLQGKGDDAVAMGVNWDRRPSVVYLEIEVIRTDDNGVLIEC